MCEAAGSLRCQAEAHPAPPRVVVLGVGNLLRRDEGVGVRVVRQLSARYELPPEVTVVDAGTASLRALPLLEGAERVVVVDAVDVGMPPGTVVRLAPEAVPPATMPVLSLHEAGPLEALAVLSSLSGRRVPAVVIGIQPGDLSPWDDRLTGPVREAVPRALAAVVAELGAAGAAVRPRGSVGARTGA